jgi:hypothetical protein
VFLKKTIPASLMDKFISTAGLLDIVAYLMVCTWQKQVNDGTEEFMEEAKDKRIRID